MLSQSSRLLSRTRQTNVAALDRYKIIRNFFRTPCDRPTLRSFHPSIFRPSQFKNHEQAQTPESQPPPPRHDENYSRFFRRLALSLPHPHRPTRDDFLKVATGFWQRMRIRFKWFTIKSFRKFNADDISAFITWFVMSQTLWILIGTWVHLSPFNSNLFLYTSFVVQPSSQ